MASRASTLPSTAPPADRAGVLGVVLGTAVLSTRHLGLPPNGGRNRLFAGLQCRGNPRWIRSAALGDVRLEVTPADPDTAVFVGLSPVADATAYLGGVERTVIDDVGPGTTSADQTELSGGAPSGAVCV